IIGIVVTGFALFAATLRVGRRILDDGATAALAGAAIGAAICAGVQSDFALAWWSEAAAAAVIVAALVLTAVRWARRTYGGVGRALRSAGTLLAVCAVGALVWVTLAFLLGQCGRLAPRAASGFGKVFGAVVLGAVVLGIAIAIVNWIRFNLRAGRTFVVREPCGVEEAAGHLVALSSGDLLSVARAQVFERLQGMTPLSRVAELMLTAAAGDARWKDDSELAVALRELGRRRARTGPSERASLDDELTVLATAWALQGKLVTAQWLAELAPADRGDVHRRAAERFAGRAPALVQALEELG
ncbi:MAG TPA: hypothetical protein VHE35_23305, partial [Kofleriaceae bacterium]|nr:hypothetical protein [Kofleriaceae bacterium]